MDQNGSGRSNQNFTFVTVSPAAADSLVRHGGFPFIAEGTPTEAIAQEIE